MLLLLLRLRGRPVRILGTLRKPGQRILVQDTPMVLCPTIGSDHANIHVRTTPHIVVNTRYQRYIGQFVLHCHILEHEDQGMMQNVQVVLPDGKGGSAKGHK